MVLEKHQLVRILGRVLGLVRSDAARGVGQRECQGQQRRVTPGKARKRARDVDVQAGVERLVPVERLRELCEPARRRTRVRLLRNRVQRAHAESVERTCGERVAPW